MSSLATIRSYDSPTPAPSATSRSRSSCTTRSMPRTASAVDGLADSAGAAAWLDALGPRLPEGGSGRRGTPSRDELVALRTVVRDALADAVAGTPTPRATLDAINAVQRTGAAVAGRALAASGRAAGRRRRPRRNACRRRACRPGGRRDRFADRVAPCRSAGVRRPRLRPDVPQGPPASGVVLEHLRQPGPTGTPLPARPRQLLDEDAVRARRGARATGRCTRFGGRLVVVGGEAGAGKTALVEASPSRWAAACCSAPASTSRPRPRRDGGGGRASEGWRVGEHPPQAARALASGR